jgi:hypothetical protein
MIGTSFRTFLVLASTLLLPSAPILAATYYVSGTGSDSASGRSPKTAFLTLQHAANLVRSGDTVYAMNGTYSTSQDGGAALRIAKSGTPDRWITYQAYPGEHPTISFNGWAGVSFAPTAAYVELKGFTIIGNNRNVTLADSLQRGSKPDPRYDGNCIAIDGRKGGPLPNRPHHIRILDNVIGECGGGGVAMIQTDYITVSGNTIYNSAWYAIYGCSAISMLEDWNSDSSTGYKMIIAGNRIFGNKELIPWVEAGKITDGEGIIVDTLRSPNIGTYQGRTLIANNVLYANGSAAIEVFRSDHVDVINNSTYGNVLMKEESGRGEMNINDASDVQVVNNIFDSAKGQNPLSINVNKPCECSFNANLYYNGANDPASLTGFNGFYADPLYIDPSAPDSWRVDLHVAPKSPAVDSGADRGPKTDAEGKPRPHGAGFDRGAYEQ